MCDKNKIVIIIAINMNATIFMFFDQYNGLTISDKNVSIDNGDNGDDGDDGVLGDDGDDGDDGVLGDDIFSTM